MMEYKGYFGKVEFDVAKGGSMRKKGSGHVPARRTQGGRFRERLHRASVEVARMADFGQVTSPYGANGWERGCKDASCCCRFCQRLHFG